MSFLDKAGHGGVRRRRGCYSGVLYRPSRSRNRGLQYRCIYTLEATSGTPNENIFIIFIPVQADTVGCIRGFQVFRSHSHSHTCFDSHNSAIVSVSILPWWNLLYFQPTSFQALHLLMYEYATGVSARSCRLPHTHTMSLDTTRAQPNIAATLLRNFDISLVNPNAGLDVAVLVPPLAWLLALLPDAASS